MDAQAVPKAGVGQVPWQSFQTQPNKFLFTASALEGLWHRIGGISHIATVRTTPLITDYGTPSRN